MELAITGTWGGSTDFRFPAIGQCRMPGPSGGECRMRRRDNAECRHRHESVTRRAGYILNGTNAQRVKGATAAEEDDLGDKDNECARCE